MSLDCIGELEENEEQGCSDGEDIEDQVQNGEEDEDQDQNNDEDDVDHGVDHDQNDAEDAEKKLGEIMQDLVEQ